MTETPFRPTLKELLTAQQSEWLLRGPQGKILGPVPEDKLLQSVLVGGLREDALVHAVGHPQWKPISAHPRLMAALARLRSRPSGIHRSDNRAPERKARVPAGPEGAPPVPGAAGPGQQRRLSPPPRPRAKTG